MLKEISLKSEYNKQQNNDYVSPSKKHYYTINFVGDLDKSIDQLISKIQCCCSAGKQLKQILKIFANKLTKVRNQRDKLKKHIKQIQQTFINDIQLLQKQIDKMNKQKEGRKKIYQDYWNGNQFYQQNPQLQKLSCKIPVINNAKMIESCTYEKNLSQISNSYKFNSQIQFQRSSYQKKCNEQLQQLMKKYNLSQSELKSIIQKCQNDHVFYYSNLNSRNSIQSYKNVNKTSRRRNQISKQNYLCHSLKVPLSKYLQQQNKQNEYIKF